MDEARVKVARDEIANCVIRADRSGLVIYPNNDQWKNTPDIAEGATVHKDQVLLLMPDLSKMQVTIGVHESIIDRVQPGLSARVRLPDRTLEAKVSSVSSVAGPAGWWTGNVVKYDTVIELPSIEGLKPGMSAEVEVTLARYEDVLTVPVAAVLATEGRSRDVVATTPPCARIATTLEPCNKGAGWPSAEGHGFRTPKGRR